MIKLAKLSGLILTIVLAFSLLGCQSAEQPEPTAPPMPPLQPGPEAVTVEVSYDEFMQNQHITKEVEVSYPGSLIVILASNPTTGFQWQKNATISNQSVMSQYGHNFVPPEAGTGTQPIAGAAGKDVWTFKSQAKGTSIISMDYSRPWVGGEKGEWTFTLTITVK